VILPSQFVGNFVHDVEFDYRKVHFP